MRRIILSAFVFVLMTWSLAPAFAAPSDHNLKTNEGVKKFFEEQQNNSGGGNG
jgi:cytochrome b subunit of formate dehydrogenase